MERCGAKCRGRQELSNSNPSTASKQETKCSLACSAAETKVESESSKTAWRHRSRTGLEQALPGRLCSGPKRPTLACSGWSQSPVRSSLPPSLACLLACLLDSSCIPDRSCTLPPLPFAPSQTQTALRLQAEPVQTDCQTGRQTGTDRKKREEVRAYIVKAVREDLRR